MEYIGFFSIAQFLLWEITSEPTEDDYGQYDLTQAMRGQDDWHLILETEVNDFHPEDFSDLMTLELIKTLPQFVEIQYKLENPSTHNGDKYGYLTEDTVKKVFDEKLSQYSIADLIKKLKKENPDKEEKYFDWVGDKLEILNRLFEHAIEQKEVVAFVIS